MMCQVRPRPDQLLLRERMEMDSGAETVALNNDLPKSAIQDECSGQMEKNQMEELVFV